MASVNRVVDYLVEQGAEFDMVSHPYTATSAETAQCAHIPGDRIAKSVLLEDEFGYLLAVVPASSKVDLGELHRHTSRNLGLSTESQLSALFSDCEPGAVPPLAKVYDLEAIVEDHLAEQTDVYFEYGDHEQLIHVSGETFVNLMGDAEQFHFTRHI